MIGIKEHSVGDDIKNEDGVWRFNGKSVQKFDAHVSKSVPLYEQGHDLVCRMSNHFVQDNSTIYEIGTSTGELLTTLAQYHSKRSNIRFIGIDCEQEMINKAIEKRDNLSLKNVEFYCDDALQYDFKPCDIIVSYYTIQFIRPSERQRMIDRIYERLNWGGAFFMYEKVRAPDARFQDLLTTVYTDFKLEQGYSPEQIIGKSQSLRGVLEPFSTQGNVDLLKRAGFIDYMTIQKMFCFEGFLAIK